MILHVDERYSDGDNASDDGEIGGEGGNDNNKEVFICDTNTVFCAKTAFWIKTILSQMSHTVKSLKLAISVFL